MQEYKIHPQEIKQTTWGSFEYHFKKKYKKTYQKQHHFIVLASIGIVVNGLYKIIGIGFGTKSLPHILASQHKGKVIKDMHAEILAIQSFRKWVIDNLPQKFNDNQLFIWDQKRQRHALNKKIKVLLYSSQPFCGDCNIKQQQSFFSGAKPLSSFKDIKYQQKKYSQNILRTKPGRIDLPIIKRSLSLCCSDKIALYNILGIQGKRLFSKVIPIYIDTIIVQSKKSMKQQIQKGVNFIARLSALKNAEKQIIQRKIFNIIINGKQRKISHQFYNNIPQVIIIQSTSEQNNQKQGVQFAGTIFKNQSEWLTGRTGLKQGRNINKYTPQKDCSEFCSSKLFLNLNPQRKQIFKYQAIKQRIKKMFGIWTDNFKQQNQF